jgi:TRAP-type C4-dicarboxylate transport system permease small subunit
VSAARQRGVVDRFIDGIEVAAAGFLAAVTVLTFAAVSARYLLNYGILDAHDFSRLLLGVLIFWGIAVSSYRGDHITVDLFWGWVGARARRAIDFFAAVFSLFCMTVFTWMMARKVVDTFNENILTFDLRAPVWIFYFLAWVGLAAAILLLIVRSIRLLISPASLEAREKLQID